MNAEERWNEAAAYAVVAALVPQRIPGFHIGRDGLRNEDIGNGCWGMSWIEGGRAVFYGYDADHNELAQHVPPVDLLAGAPDWLPWEWLDEVLRTLLLVSCVEWWDGTAWSRAPLPEGVSSGEGDWFGGSAVEQCYLDLADPDREEEAAEAFDALREAALRRAVDRSVVEPLADVLDREIQQDEEWEPDIAGALATAERLGVAPGSTRPELPAGRGEPADRRVVSACPPQDLVSHVMRGAAELDRPAPVPGPALDRVAEWLRDHRAGAGITVAHLGGLEWRPAGFFGPRSEFLDADGKWVDPELSDALSAWREEEAHPERGRWLYARIRPTGAGVEVDRAYDHLPAWWGSSPVLHSQWGVLRAELRSRDPRWRPDWTSLLEEDLRRTGVPRHLCWRPAPSTGPRHR